MGFSLIQVTEAGFVKLMYAIGQLLKVIERCGGIEDYTCCFRHSIHVTAAILCPVLTNLWKHTVSGEDIF